MAIIYMQLNPKCSDCSIRVFDSFISVLCSFYKQKPLVGWRESFGRASCKTRFSFGFVVSNIQTTLNTLLEHTQFLL